MKSYCDSGFHGTKSTGCGSGDRALHEEAPRCADVHGGAVGEGDAGRDELGSDGSILLFKF